MLREIDKLEDIMDSPRIYVASLSDYNAGRLHGVWIDATQEPEDIAKEVAEMLATSREPIAEERAIHDYEGFYGLNISEYESFERVSEIAQAIEKHGEAVAFFLANGDDLEHFEDAYRGEWDSEKDYAEQFADDMGLFENVPDDSPLRMYFDYESFAHDLFIGDFWSADGSNGKVYVFDRNY